MTKKKKPVKIEYDCLKCQNDCKQDIRAKVIKCPLYKPIKKPILSILALMVLLACLPCQAQSKTQEPVIDLTIIASIESSNNPLAYNKHSGARGLYQVTAICLKDYNAWNRTEIALESLFDPDVCLTVAKWYLEAGIPHYLRNYGIEDTVYNRLWAYNAGVGKVRDNILPKETVNYINKYNKLKEATHD